MNKIMKNKDLVERENRSMRSFFENRKFLNPFIYQYDIAEDEKQSSIQLRFDEENFCHLLGIESIVKYSVSKKLLIGFIV
jgi:hypothetical protein